MEVSCQISYAATTFQLQKTPLVPIEYEAGLDSEPV